MEKNYGLDVSRERSERSVQDYHFGATSPACIALIPEKERVNYLPQGELQRGKEDFMDCVARCFNNILETKFNWLYRNNKLKPEDKKWLEQKGYVVEGMFAFSDRYVAILSNTTRQGNSLKAPVHAIHEHGLVPKSLLPASSSMTWDEYHKGVTSEIKALGKEFLKRFPIEYDQVDVDNIENAMKTDMVSIGLWAWPFPNENGIYERRELPFNHAVMAWAGRTYVFDNYLG